ncbi:hypothetical protein IU449_13485 [Nocardia higoensis]|uniref:Uncharacterized protein n=1 Tax=Nocardia higoensis TaxID=228599 RepID=A0ABS0DFS8_9NOCA|nr:hypothetical protein [Nocardia higoensis]MBF6355543.1 hypothetical protein [Nocardia higoensis]
MARNETRATVTGAAPALLRALRQAAELAERRQRGWFGVEDVLAVLLDDDQALLGRHAEAHGLGEAYTQIRNLAAAIVPGSTHGESTPAGPPAVVVSVTGPDSDELMRHISSA